MALRKSSMLRNVSRLSGPGFFALDAGFNMSQGDDIGTAAIKSAATTVVAASNPLAFTAYTLGSVAIDGASGIIDLKRERQAQWNKSFAYSNEVGGNFYDSQRAQTMRQAAVQAIQGSKMNARSALGGEAKIMHTYATRKY